MCILIFPSKIWAKKVYITYGKIQEFKIITCKLPLVSVVGSVMLLPPLAKNMS